MLERGNFQPAYDSLTHPSNGRSCAAADAEVGDHSPSKPSGISTYCRRFQWQIRTACNQTFYFQIQWDVHRHFLRSSTGFTEFRQFRDAQAVHSEYRLVKRFTWLHFAHQKLLFDHAIVTLKSQGDSHNNTKFLLGMYKAVHLVWAIFFHSHLWLFWPHPKTRLHLVIGFLPQNFTTVFVWVCCEREWNGSKIVGHSQIAKISIHQIICWKTPLNFKGSKLWGVPPTKAFGRPAPVVAVCAYPEIVKNGATKETNSPQIPKQPVSWCVPIFRFLGEEAENVSKWSLVTA